MTNRGTTRRGVFSALAGAAAATTLPTEPAEAAERPFQAAASSKPAQRPNILFIFADDLGWADLSSYGSPDIKTPNLDRLASSGVRFTQAYSGGAVCSPTRMSLYTGRYPGRLPGGLPEPIAAPSPTAGLPPEHPTLASLLKKAGYTTAMFGKWHNGFLPWFGPLRSGWDEFFGNYSGAVDYYSKITGQGVDLFEGETRVESDEYYTDTLAHRAEAFLRREHRAPWLLNLNFTSPHWPWEAPGDRAVSAEITARVRAGDTFALFHTDGGSLETYRKMVENLDVRVGQVLSALRQTGQEENTLVIFSSDNGGERYSYQWPLTGTKASLNEGGIRVPTIVRWPARIHGGQVSHEPVVTPDWTATLLEIAGAAPDPAYPLDGTSFAGYLLHGSPAPGHDLFWRTRQSRALRRGNWKYLRDTDTDQLFDLDHDPREQADLAQKHPDLVAELRARWEELAATQLPYPS
ncbi:N-acetylgalactosamine 6-sulfate sulfatase [Actinoplanes sp. SE50]|uniref:sulfatase family protein n=1 Tax=unclassified Actinoplanes TaxID=2626549 RepID=UPI00023ECEEF|nr:MULTISPECIES: sulfatase-like hydrolase/transferase [unclassified Actinoplanes]AEV86051.1 sulfatase [Actinoplanes sp. SE50/110]ATO84449.1 N-acetylgalactosamine 6-sulfate sulfatase [Actinoplanes sp. SE50]SLM01859.1 N-acetylgalactosamine-6-sulfatase [Actinoplanes sp. SE50/110]